MITCPVCSQEFHHRKEGKCPICDIELIKVKNDEGGKNYWIPKDVNDPKITEISSVITEHKGQDKSDPGANGLLVSEPNEMPEIRLMDVETNHYRVIYRGILDNDWVYCPGCWRKQFQNMIIGTGGFVQSHKCTSCKATFELYIFAYQNRALDTV